LEAKTTYAQYEKRKRNQQSGEEAQNTRGGKKKGSKQRRRVGSEDVGHGASTCCGIFSNKYLRDG